MTESEVLKRALADGIIDFGYVQKEIELNERKKFLEMHTHKIWEKDGKWYTYLHSNGKRKLVKKSKLEDLETAIVNFYKSEVDEPTTKVIFDDWINQKLKYGEITLQTFNRYSNDYKRFIEGSIIDCKTIYISEDMLEEFIRSTIAKHSLTAKAWSNLRTLLYGIFKRAKKQGYTSISITEFMGDLDISRKAFTVNKKSKSQQVFTRDEMNTLCNYLFSSDGTNAGLGIIFAFFTGLRSGELSALKWSDIDEYYIHVCRTEINYKTDNGMIYEVRDFPKTEAAIRDVVLTSEAKVILDKLSYNMDTNEYVFTKDGERIHGHVFSNKLKRLCDKFHMESRSLHKCRKTYASMLSKAHVPDAILTDQLGHSDISTTRKHYIFDNSNLDEVYSIIENALSNQSNQCG